MAFLFGKKKQSHPAAPASRDGVHTSSGSNSSIPTINGLKEKPAGSAIGASPGGSVSNSVGGGATPSPDNGRQSEGDGQVRMTPNFVNQRSSSKIFALRFCGGQNASSNSLSSPNSFALVLQPMALI